METFDPTDAPTVAQALEQLQREGFAPAIIISVRGADGTPIVDADQLDQVEASFIAAPAFPPEAIIALLRQMLAALGFRPDLPRAIELVRPEDAGRLVIDLARFRKNGAGTS
jgi:hypothetical protein